MTIPAGTKFAGIPPSNPNINKKSKQLNIDAPIYDISEFGGGGAQSVFELIPQGLTDTTTAKAQYGINVIKVTDSSNVALRLPLAETGKSVTIINETALAVRVFPSVAGGSINGQVNGSVILGTNNPYTFFCTENPLPGAWTVSLPAIAQIVSEEIQVVKGAPGSGQVIAFNSGLPGVSNATSIGSGMSGGPTPSLILTGPFNTLTSTNATATKLKVYTNILASDLSSTASFVKIQVGLAQAFQVSATGSTSGIRMFHVFEGGDWNEVSGGLAYNGEIGDNGTLYYEIEDAFNFSPEFFIIGNNFQNGASGIFSNGYYTFNVEVGTNVPAKTYKFKFFLEYA